MHPLLSSSDILFDDGACVSVQCADVTATVGHRLTGRHATVNWRRRRREERREGEDEEEEEHETDMSNSCP